MASLTEDLEVHVTARHLTDPALALRLAKVVGVMAEFEKERGYPQSVPFINDLRAALVQYAHDLAGLHDQVVRDVIEHWEPTLDEGPIDDDDEDPDDGPTFYRRGGPIDGIK